MNDMGMTKTAATIILAILASAGIARAQNKPTLADASPYVTKMNNGRPVDCTAEKVKIRFGSGRGEGYCQAVLSDLIKYWETGITLTEHEKTVSRAVEGVNLLRGQHGAILVDPDSLQLDTVATRDSKHQGGTIEICYFFRARNGMNGYASGEAILRNNGLSILFNGASYTPHNLEEAVANACRQNVLTADITKEVLAALNPVPTAQSPAEKTKRAQQYADCLKLAESNPNVVCKEN